MILLSNKFNNSKAVFIFNYINIPILSGFKIDQKTSIMLGPEFGYLTSVYLAHLGNENLNVSKDYPPKFDVDLDIGLNYKFSKISILKLDIIMVSKLYILLMLLGIVIVILKEQIVSFK